MLFSTFFRVCGVFVVSTARLAFYVQKVLKEVYDRFKVL